MAPTKDEIPKEPRHGWISSLLVLCHVIETAIQVYLCFHYWAVTIRWAAGMAALLAASVALINGASIVAVRRSLDFKDRWFGQCLCYILHLSLLGLIWRFLKLTFLYDRADLRELALLRFIQVHLQTLPSLLLQTCLIYQHGLMNVSVTGIAILLAISQLVLAALSIALTSMVLSTTVSGTLVPKRTDEESANPRILSLSSLCRGHSERSGDDLIRFELECSHHCVVTVVRSACLLWCRIVAVGVFMTEFHVWTLIVFGVHWCIALLWLVLQDSASESGLKTPSPAVSLFRRALVAYLLVFDWPPRYQSENPTVKNPVLGAIKSAGSWLDVVGIGGPPRSVAMAVYYGVSGVENAAMLSLWFHFGPASDLMPAVARLTTLASCTAAFTLGILCVVASTQGTDETPPVSGTDSAADPVYIRDADPPNYTKVQPTNGNAQPRDLQPRAVVQIHRQAKTERSAAVVARLTQSALSVANQLNHGEPAHSIQPKNTQLWDRLSLGESSNSRNTNTLEGALMGSGSGSGLGLTVGSCPSPNPAAAKIATGHHLTWHRSASPFRDPSQFTGSRSSFSALALLAKTAEQPMVKRPYVCCPRSSTPKRLLRRNSSCSSLPSVAPKGRRMVQKSATATPKRRHRWRQCRRRGTCHCRIFDVESPALDIFIEDNRHSSRPCRPGAKTASLGRLSQGFETDPQPAFQILCAKCLGTHDPLLTSCSRCHGDRDQSAIRLQAISKSQTLPAARTKSTQHQHPAETASLCSTYPSETEMTLTRQSDSDGTSSDSDATYTTWPPTIRFPTMERLLSQNDPSPWNYVNAWLANAGHPKTGRIPALRTDGTRPKLAGSRPPKSRPNQSRTAGHVHHVHARPHPGVEDIYTAYCTVPPRPGKSIKELSLIRRFDAVVPSLDAEIVV